MKDVAKIQSVEVWASVPGYEGLYAISNKGNCKRLSRIIKNPKNEHAVLKEMVLSKSLTRDGYVQYTFYKDGKRTTLKAHRLVAQVFLSNLKEYDQVNHINSIKTDNSVDNLEWVNHRENVSHRYKTKITSSGYTGVEVLKNLKTNQGKPYRARININYKTVHLGVFETELEASMAYQKALSEHKFNNKYL